MTRYGELVESVAGAVASGELAAGASVPSVRALARSHRTTVATSARALAELGRAGVVVTSPRRRSRVAPEGRTAALRLLRGGRVLRLAGSDDPALDLLLAECRAEVDRTAARGSLGGLAALWRGEAEAAALHVRHSTGGYNSPFASRILAGREPLLVHLWRREQGIVVPAGNPDGIASVAELVGLRVALRGPGTGTRALLERELLRRGFDPAAVSGPEAGSHLDVALAVASGLAQAGVAVRSVGALAGLDFVPIAWEPFEVALPAGALGGLEPLLRALAGPDLRARIEGLAGYDLDRAGSVRKI